MNDFCGNTKNRGWSEEHSDEAKHIKKRYGSTSLMAGLPKNQRIFWEKGGAATRATDFLWKHKKSEQAKLAPTWQGQKDLNPRHLVLETPPCTFGTSCNF